jgi:hypothetical protein
MEVAIFATKTATNNLEKLIAISDYFKHRKITSISTGIMLTKTKILPVCDSKKGAAISATIT